MTLYQATDYFSGSAQWQLLSWPYSSGAQFSTTTLPSGGYTLANTASGTCLQTGKYGNGGSTTPQISECASTTNCAQQTCGSPAWTMYCNPGWIMMAPGCDNSYAVMRFTPPAAGTYNMVVKVNAAPCATLVTVSQSGTGETQLLTPTQVASTTDTFNLMATLYTTSVVDTLVYFPSTCYCCDTGVYISFQTSGSTPLPTNISSPTTTSSATAAPVGAIAGGVVGGVLCAALLAFVLFRSRRPLASGKQDALGTTDAALVAVEEAREPAGRVERETKQAQEPSKNASEALAPARDEPLDPPLDHTGRATPQKGALQGPAALRKAYKVFISYVKVDTQSETGYVFSWAERTHHDAAFFYDVTTHFDLSQLVQAVLASTNVMCFLSPGYGRSAYCLVEMCTSVKAELNVVNVIVHKPGMKTFDFEAMNALIATGDVSALLDERGWAVVTGQGISKGEVRDCLRKVMDRKAFDLHMGAPPLVIEAELNEIWKGIV